MRPDEDYAEMDDMQPAASSRAMSWMVLAVAVGGFAALAYYAYHSGAKPAAEGEATTIQADATPIKEAPANPEGEQFPDKDKTIYDVIAPNGQATSGEKLMPDAEHPVAATNMEDSEDDVPTTESTNVPAAKDAAASPSTSTFVAGNETKPMTDASSRTPQSVSEQPVAATAKPVTAATPGKPVASYAAPQMVNEKTLTGKREVPVENAKMDAKTKAKPRLAAKTAGSGAYMVQLGAFKSESEAQASWKKISAAHSDVLSGSPKIVEAEVNGATYYRLRTGSFASSADAKAVCGKLGGAACMVVK